MVLNYRPKLLQEKHLLTKTKSYHNLLPLLPATVLLSLIIFDHAFSLCFSYTKVVAKGMKKAEMILKVITLPLMVFNIIIYM